MTYTVKRVNDFPVPSRVAINHLLPDRELFPARESLARDISAGGGKMANLFLQCSPLGYRLATKRLFRATLKGKSSVFFIQTSPCPPRQDCLPAGIASHDPKAVQPPVWLAPSADALAARSNRSGRYNHPPPMGADVTSTLLQWERTLHQPSSNGSGLWNPPSNERCLCSRASGPNPQWELPLMLSFYTQHASKGSFLYISCYESVSQIRTVLRTSAVL